MKLVLTNDAESAPGVIVVDHFTMTHIVHFLRGEGIEIPESHLTPHAQETAAPQGKQPELFTNSLGSDGTNSNAVP